MHPGAKAPYGGGWQQTAKEGRGWQGMAKDGRGWQAAPSSVPGPGGICRATMWASGRAELVLLCNGGGQACGSLFWCRLRMVKIPWQPACSCLTLPASGLGFGWFDPFAADLAESPSTAFPAQGQMVSLHSHRLLLPALDEDLDLENKALYFLLKEQADGLPRWELSCLCNLLSPAASLNTSHGTKCLLLAGVLLSPSPLR